MEVSEVLQAMEMADSSLDSISDIFSGIVAIIDTIGFGIALIFSVISFLVAIVLLILQAIPLYTLAKRAGCKYAWLAWCPFFSATCCLFVLSKISGKEEFEFAYGRFHTKHNSLIILGYALMRHCGGAIITFLIGILNLIPGLGQILSLVASLLYLLPGVYMAIAEYVYLRDTLNVFKADQEKNRIHVFIVVVLDSLLTGGFASVVYLWSMIRLHPLPVPTAEGYVVE